MKSVRKGLTLKSLFSLLVLLCAGFALITVAGAQASIKAETDGSYTVSGNAIMGNDYVLLIVSGKHQTLPTINDENRLIYIDQKTAESNTIAFFGVQPSENIDATIFLTTQGAEAVLVGTIDDIQLGDVNGDGSITISDCVLVTQHANEVSVLEGTPLKLADTNHDGKVDKSDAIAIMKHISGEATLAEQ